MASYDYDGGNNELVWDLRQFYAKYIANYLLRFDEAKEIQNYPVMKNQLEWLFKTVKGKVKKKYTEKDFTDDMKLILTYATKHPLAWDNRGKNEERQELEQLFMNLYSNLFSAMVDAGIFGKGYDYSGL